MSNVQAIFVSDLHLQAKAPVARSAEPCWFDAMERPLVELANLADRYDAPIVYAGDVFDKWNTPAEVINFAMDYLPHGFAIPGQHDLPYHSYQDMGRSAYWTLVQAGVLQNLEPSVPTRLCTRGNVIVYGWPWGFDVEPPPPRTDVLQVAVVHAYVHTVGTGYEGAPEASRLASWAKRLRGYNVAVFGDNHIHFRGNVAGCHVVNNGSLMRRHINQQDHRPSCCLLHGDGTVTIHRFDIQGEQLLARTQNEQKAAEVFNTEEFLDDLRVLGGSNALDYEDALKRHMDKEGCSESVRSAVWRAVGGG